MRLICNQQTGGSSPSDGSILRWYLQNGDMLKCYRLAIGPEASREEHLRVVWYTKAMTMKEPTYISGGYRANTGKIAGRSLTTPLGLVKVSIG